MTPGTEVLARVSSALTFTDATMEQVGGESSTSRQQFERAFVDTIGATFDCTDPCQIKIAGITPGSVVVAFVALIPQQHAEIEAVRARIADLKASGTAITVTADFMTTGAQLAVPTVCHGACANVTLGRIHQI